MVPTWTIEQQTGGVPWPAVAEESAASKGLLGLDPTSLLGRLTWESDATIAGARVNNTVQLGFLSYASRGVELNHCTIGRFCSLAPRVVVGATEHPVDRLSTSLLSFANNGAPFVGSEVWPRWSMPVPSAEHPGVPTRIGHDVWVGDGAFIRRGVTVGDGAVIGAASVVTRDVPPYAIVAGVPARPIRSRFDPPRVERLRALAWWRFDLSSHREALQTRIDRIDTTLDYLESAVRAGELPMLSPPAHSVWRDEDGMLRGVTHPRSFSA